MGSYIFEDMKIKILESKEGEVIGFYPWIS